MKKENFTSALIIVLITLGLFKVDEIQAENINAKFPSQSMRSFNPFSLSSWFNIPSQFMQYWFPLFGSSYYPSHLQKPTTTARSTISATTARSTVAVQASTISPTAGAGGQNQTQRENSKPKTNNIFGVTGSSGDTVEYLLSPNDIEW